MAASGVQFFFWEQLDGTPNWRRDSLNVKLVAENDHVLVYASASPTQRFASRTAHSAPKPRSEDGVREITDIIVDLLGNPMMYR